MNASGVKSFRTFICTRCRKEESISGVSDQPEDWIGVSFVSPPLAVISEEPRSLLCHECECLFADFMYGDRS